MELTCWIKYKIAINKIIAEGVYVPLGNIDFEINFIKYNSFALYSV